MQRDRRGEPDLLGLIRWARDHNAFSGLAEDLWQAYDAGLISAEKLWQYVGPALSVRRSDLCFYDAAPFRLPIGLDAGDIWGNDAEGNPTWFPASFVDGHVLLAGATRSGKSGLLRHWGVQWPTPDGVRSIVIVDSSKMSFCGLVPLWRGRGVSGLWVTAATWRTNRFQPPPGCDPRVYLNYLVPFDAQLFGLQGARSEADLRRIYHQAYDALDVFAGAQRWPCPLDIEARITAEPGMHPEVWAALHSRQTAICDVLPDGMRATRRGVTLADLLELNAVLELGGLADMGQKYVLLPQIYGVLLAALARPRVGGRRRLLMLDDMQSSLALDVALRGRGLVGMDQMIGVVREALTLIISLQTIQRDVSAHVLANTGLKVMFQQATAKDLAQLGADLLCTPEQMRWAAQYLEPGVVVLRLLDGPCRYPILYRYPRLDLPDAEPPATSMGAGVVVETAAEYVTWKPYASKAARAVPTWSADDLRFLRAVVASPRQPASAYGAALGLNGAKAGAIRKRFVAAGVLREHVVQATPKGRPSLLLEPTKAADQLLREAEGGR